MASNKIELSVTVERRSECNITKEMVKEELEVMDELELCCDEGMNDLVDIIWERIVDYLKHCASTLYESECAWDLFTNRGGLDEEEVVKYLIKEVYDDDGPTHCNKCWENT